MTTLNFEMDGISCVLLGNFNPAIVQPSWLLRHELVSEAVADAAEIEIIRPEVASFSVSPFQVEVLADRFKVEVVDSGDSPLLKDFIRGIFGALRETPVQNLGLNRHMHVRVASEEDLHRIGHQLAPKEVYDGLLESPGMRSLTIWGTRPESSVERFQVQVEASTKIEPGVYFAANNHYKFDKNKAAPHALDLIEREWDEVLRFSRNCAETILSRCLEEMPV